MLTAIPQRARVSPLHKADGLRIAHLRAEIVRQVPAAQVPVTWRRAEDWFVEGPRRRQIRHLEHHAGQQVGLDCRWLGPSWSQRGRAHASASMTALYSRSSSRRQQTSKKLPPASRK